MEAMITITEFVTSIGQLVLVVLLIAATVYIVRILRNVSDVSDRLRRGSEIVAGDIAALRATVKDGGKNVWDAVQAILLFLPRKARHFAKRGSKREEKKEERKD